MLLVRDRTSSSSFWRRWSARAESFRGVPSIKSSINAASTGEISMQTIVQPAGLRLSRRAVFATTTSSATCQAKTSAASVQYTGVEISIIVRPESIHEAASAEGFLCVKEDWQSPRAE